MLGTTAPYFRPGPALTVSDRSRAPGQQHWKVGSGEFVAAVKRGVSVAALGTLAKLGLHASGNADGQPILQQTLADHFGSSRRTVQRDLAELRITAGLRVHRAKKGPKTNYPNLFWVDRAAPEDPGLYLRADLISHPAFRSATRTHRGILLVMLDSIGRQGQRTVRSLAELCRVSMSCIRKAVAYFEDVDLLEREAVFGKKGEQRASSYRLLTQPKELLKGLARWFVDRVTSPKRAYGPTQRREERHRVLIEQVGPLLTRWDEYAPGGNWWRNVEIAAETGDLEQGAAHLASLIRSARASWKEHWGKARPPPKVSTRRRDLAAIIPELVRRRPEWAAGGP